MILNNTGELGVWLQVRPNMLCNLPLKVVILEGRLQFAALTGITPKIRQHDVRGSK